MWWGELARWSGKNELRSAEVRKIVGRLSWSITGPSKSILTWNLEFLKSASNILNFRFPVSMQMSLQLYEQLTVWCIECCLR